MSATRVRSARWHKEPVARPLWTFGGDRQPTALAIAGAGKLPEIARRMGHSAAWLYKRAQGERGCECELTALFPAMHDAGVPFDRALLIVKRVRVLCLSAYGADLPDFEELQDRETRLDGDEDVYQRAVNRAGGLEKATTEELIDARLGWEQSAAVYETLAALGDRELKARGIE